MQVFKYILFDFINLCLQEKGLFLEKLCLLLVYNKVKKSLIYTRNKITKNIAVMF